MNVRSLVCLVLLSGAVAAEPGVLVLFDGRKAPQRDLSRQARRCLEALRRSNQLETYQFWIDNADFSDPTVAERWRRDFLVDARELPALAVVRRQGNRFVVDNLLRRYRNSQQASEQAVGCVQRAFPNLVRDARIHTRLQVVSVPAGARVWLDGREAGSTPAELDTGAGPHRLRLEHPDCQTVNRPVRAELGETTPIQLELERKPAQLSFESVGNVTLQVALDGAEPVATPFSRDLKAGPHHIVASAPGQYQLETDVRAEPEQTTLVRLTPARARLRLGLAGFEASGYVVYGTDSAPYQVNLDGEELSQRLRAGLATLPDLEMVDSEAHCGLRLELAGSDRKVVGEATLVDAEGKELARLQAERGMPFFTLDQQGSVQLRAREVVDDLLQQLGVKLPEFRGLARTAPGEAAGRVETSSTPLSP